MTGENIHISPWLSLKQTVPTWNGLLVGNGGSIALHGGFGYTSLYDEAAKSKRLEGTKALFGSLGTVNFEYVLLALAHAIAVGKALGSDIAAAKSAYDEVRNALIDTVKAAHCTHAAVKSKLPNIARFAQDFETVVTFNYDLTLYWATFALRSKIGTWFKDGFVNDRRFDSNWRRLREPQGAEGSTLVFYGHGSLILGSSTSGAEQKIAIKEQPSLLDAITEQWDLEGVAPLFVSEGTAEAKLQAIRRSHYLSAVYDQVLSSFGGRNVVVYGLSFADNDDHILDALAKSPPARLAVSVYVQPGTDPQANVVQAACLSVKAKIMKHLGNIPVDFFDASSPGCWSHPCPTGLGPT